MKQTNGILTLTVTLDAESIYTVNGNSGVMICTLSSAHWQQASKAFSPAAL